MNATPSWYRSSGATSPSIGSTAQIATLDVSEGLACGEATFYKPTNMQILGNTRGSSCRGELYWKGPEDDLGLRYA